VFFVCEGRNKTPNTPGLTLKEVADLLMDLGCTEAINLDGGGSSCMLINGQETIIPSDGKQRAITSMVAMY
jgi:exopolysaccharide biosynthesis protein